MSAPPQSIEDLNLKTTKPQQRSAPERWAEWLFKTCGSWRNILAFALVVALTYISIRFNYELGKLSAVDETSKTLLPSGYALLDLSALFLSGYVGLKTRSPIRKLIAWIWFAFLLCLSLWAAAAFTMSVDYRQSLAPLDAQIEQKQRELATQRASVETWQKNVEDAVVYKTKHQGTLSREQIKETMLAGELAHLESQRVPPAQIIYERAAPYVGIDAATLQLTIRLLWAAALTLSPIILVLLVAVEFGFVGRGQHKAHATPPPSPDTDPTGGGDGTSKAGKRKGKGFTDRFTTSFTQLGNAALTQTGKPVVTHSGKGEHDEREQRRAARQANQRLADSADTGTDARKGNRYAEVRQQVRAGKVRPSKPAIKKAAQCGQATADKYLAAMVDEGIIVRLENGQHQLAKDNVVTFTKAAEGGRA